VPSHASEYYKYLPPEHSWPARIAILQRRRMFHKFTGAFGLDPSRTILDVGVTSNDSYALDNYLEALYPWKDRITAVGIEDGSHLERQHPGMRFLRVEPGPLPFPHRAFDIVHSSAVIEHVGNRQRQAEFVSELWRVAKFGIFVATPNRWFPVEFHTVLPLVHWLPPATFRAVLCRVGKSFYAREENLNLLSRRALRASAEAAGVENVAIEAVSLLGWPTNLLLIGRRE
jgi:hypothetical protein